MASGDGIPDLEAALVAARAERRLVALDFARVPG
jgi:hypothetical protein